MDLEHRKLLWKMHHASADFSMVIETCEHILRDDSELSENIYYALIVSIFTIYSRPFTQSTGTGKLEAKIVPAKHRKLHRELLRQRNQIYAHSDATGAPSTFGNINQVRFFVSHGVIQPGVLRWRSELAVLNEIVSLCESLKQKTKYWIDRIQNKHFPRLKVKPGDYLINLDPKGSSFFVRAPAFPASASIVQINESRKR
jgi:hypothetical protein